MRVLSSHGVGLQGQPQVIRLRFKRFHLFSKPHQHGVYTFDKNKKHQLLKFKINICAPTYRKAKEFGQNYTIMY